MKRLQTIAGALALAFVLAALPLPAYAQVAAAGSGNVEELRYSWRLKGGMRFIAGLMFPTNGVGSLTTTFGNNVESELLITAPSGKSGGFYAYESTIDGKGKTLETYHGYAWNDESRSERTVFDYSKGLARIQREKRGAVEKRVKKLPGSSGEFRDVLTAIFFLRQNAGRIKAPMQTNIFSDGKEYPVVFKPGQSRTFEIEGRSVQARAFEVVDAPGGKKWPGGVIVWLTADDQRLPVRIEIRQSMASLQLDLQKIQSETALLASL